MRADWPDKRFGFEQQQQAFTNTRMVFDHLVSHQFSGLDSLLNATVI